MKEVCSQLLVEKEIEEVYNNWRKAMMSANIQFLDALLTADFTTVLNGVKAKNKCEELLWLTIKNVQYLRWEDKNLVIEVGADKSLVACTQSLEVLVYDLPAKINRQILLNFVKKDNAWYLQQVKENTVRFTDRN